tara:strand:- start:78 stop:1796 length:1719 start_codon:yes stop_codon:yes gene_type:complete
MCGIYGITAKDEAFIKQYITTCSHRGPDGQGIWSDDFVTLGHNLLAITETNTHSQQPWITPRGNIVIYNGEIFNYFELLNKYPNFVPQTTCDTELLAWGLDEFGIKFIDEIDSMHALAYYVIADKKIYLSRDHAGIKPLHYAEISQGIVFGSEIKGMIDKVPNARKVDQMALSCFSLSGVNVTRNTFFTNIKKVLAGETLVYDIDNKTLRTQSKYKIYPHATESVDLEEFRSQMHNTVKMCAIGKRQIGVFLSGGIDSTMVAYELNKVQPPAWTFTNEINPLPKADENFNSDANAAQILAKHCDFNHTKVEITPQIYFGQWEDAIWQIEQPIYNANIPMYSYTNKLMHEKGVVVTMAGDLGDELLCGYPKYLRIYKGKSLSHRETVLLWLQRLKRPLSLPNTKYNADQIADELMSTVFTQDIWNPQDTLASYMTMDQVGLCPEEFFNRNDRFGMGYSMEGRFPLATKKFMTYCMNIRTDLKLTNNEDYLKHIPRQAYKDLMPKQIINKEKTGWTAPATFWAKQNMDNDLLEYKYDQIFIDQQHGIQGLKQGSKAMVPGMITSAWATKYNMRI